MHLRFIDTPIDTVKPENDTVFSLIKQNNRITAAKVSESLSTTKRRIKKLKEQNIIEGIGSNKTGYWKINEK